MPTYEYACTECGDQSEVVQKFTDDPLTVCNACGGRLRKVFSPVGIVFKGAGFYRTDSRAAAKEAAAKEPVAAAQKPNGAEAGTKTAGDSKSGASAAPGANGSGSSSGSGSGSSGSSSGSGSSGNGSPGGGSSAGSGAGGKSSSAKVA